MTTKPLTIEELDKLSELVGKMSAGPWCPECVAGSIRHLDRNVDRDDYSFCEFANCQMPDRYDGNALALLRNNAESLIAMARREAERQVASTFAQELAAEQVDLSPEEKRAIYTNLHELYDDASTPSEEKV